MKKIILNLSILMLLSSTINLSASDLAGCPSPESVIEAARNLTTLGIGQAVVENVDIPSGITDAFVDQLPQIDVAISNVSTSLASNFGKSLGVFLNYVPESVKTTVCKHSKVAGVVAGVCALGAGAYAVNRYVQSRGGTSVLSPSRTFGSGVVSSATNLFSPTTDEDQDTKALKEQIDLEVAKRDGNVDALVDGRILLSKYSEGDLANLEALKYLVEKYKANHLVPADPEGRSLIVFPSVWGKTEILDYLLSLGGFTQENKIDALRHANSGFSAQYFDQETFDKISDLLKLN
jgi:hypothetical protein